MNPVGAGKTPDLEDLREMHPRELGALFGRGHGVAFESIGTADYRGVSLGIPHLVERMFWTTFVKSFRWNPQERRLHGWNVRLEQTGLNGPVRPLRDKAGAVACFGPFEVLSIPTSSDEEHTDSGLLLHYGLGAPGGYSPLQHLRDPVVSMDAGGAQVLLGRTFIDLGFSIPTPSYFLLERLDGLL